MQIGGVEKFLLQKYINDLNHNDLQLITHVDGHASGEKYS